MTICFSCSRIEAEEKVYWRRGELVVLVEEVSVGVHGSYTCIPHVHIGGRRETVFRMRSEKTPESQVQQ